MRQCLPEPSARAITAEPHACSDKVENEIRHACTHLFSGNKCMPGPARVVSFLPRLLTLVGTSQWTDASPVPRHAVLHRHGVWRCVLGDTSRRVCGSRGQVHAEVGRREVEVPTQISNCTWKGLQWVGSGW